MEKCVRVEFNCQSLITLKVIFLSLTGLNCMGILFRIIIDMRIFHIAKNMRTMGGFCNCAMESNDFVLHIEHTIHHRVHYLRENQRKMPPYAQYTVYTEAGYGPSIFSWDGNASVSNRDQQGDSFQPCAVAIS